jgi:cellulose synthase/poly-beta-1,6-N-acetylglucosamine synthase-like glycosyltransferase
MLGAAVAASVAGHLGYPAALLAVTWRRKVLPQPADSGSWPSVTVVVPAYRESAVMSAKVRDCETNGYPGSLDVLVVADDAATASAARAAGAEVIESPDRRGKAAAMSTGLKAASGEVVVFTDANVELQPGSIARLARWFVDPSVGGVTGQKRHRGGRESAYWTFESWLKERENRLGTTIGIVGECVAVRRDGTPDIPDDVVVDDFWLALAIVRNGLRVVYEPAAVATEVPAGPAEEWERRTRIVAGALDLLRRQPDMLGPRFPVVAFEVWGHRLWRMSVGPLVHAALLLSALVKIAGPGPAARWARAFVVAHLGAGASWLLGERAPAPCRAVGQVMYLQVVGLGGVVRFVRGGVAAAWPKPERPDTHGPDTGRGPACGSLLS